MRATGRKLSTPGSEPSAAEAPELPERWSAARKTELVLRLLRRVIANFIERYNHEWLIERLDYRTPAQVRAEGWRAAA
jgi:transposase InsO family protein